MKRFGLIAGAMVFIIAGSVTRADATAVTYTDFSTWSGAVGSFGTETFNGFSSDTTFQNTTVALSGNMSVTGTPGTNGALTQKIDASPFEFGGNYQDDGTSYLLGDITGAQFVRFNFGTPLTAWGIDTVGIADGGRPTTINVFDASNSLITTIALASDSSNSQHQFYGFQLTGGSQAAYLTFTNAGSNDVFGIDNVRFASAAAPVPEPATLVLLGTGLVVAARRRRSSKS